MSEYNFVRLWEEINRVNWVLNVTEITLRERSSMLRCFYLGVQHGNGQALRKVSLGVSGKSCVPRGQCESFIAPLEHRVEVAVRSRGEPDFPTAERHRCWRSPLAVPTFLF